MKAPKFWFDKTVTDKDWRVRLLSPLARLVENRTQKRFQQAPYISPLPVICVGNITLGGTGKTPVVQSIAQLLQENDLHPAILLRGYGGTRKTPIKISPDEHSSHDVGDEALLHARHFPTYVSPDRAEGARLIERDGHADIIIMDDGFQNPGLAKTCSLVVVDGQMGWGNGFVIPAGPLREPVEKGLKRADALVVMGENYLSIPSGITVLQACFSPDPSTLETLKGKKVIAFAGIGHPDKFFNMLKDQGLSLVETVAFADHAPIPARKIQTLAKKAKDCGGILVTTAKDAMRLPHPMHELFSVVDGSVVWQDKERLFSLFQDKKII